MTFRAVAALTVCAATSLSGTALAADIPPPIVITIGPNCAMTVDGHKLDRVAFARMIREEPRREVVMRGDPTAAGCPKIGVIQDDRDDYRPDQ